jgi:hypothetical protein
MHLVLFDIMLENFKRGNQHFYDWLDRDKENNFSIALSPFEKNRFTLIVILMISIN